jgi:DNA-binding response OmpR family regulator
LLAEDDPSLAGFVQKGLREAGYAVDHAADGEDALHLGSLGYYDLIIMDLMLPKLDGLAVIARLRDAGIKSPVLILSAKRSVDDRVKGLQIGGDDYLTKPFSFAELVARIAALIRRTSRQQDVSVITLKDVSIDLLRREVTRQGQKVELQAREFALLEYLMRHPDQPISKTLILEKIWDFGFDPQTNVVDVLVCRLRHKIDRNFSPRRIVTMRGIGYVFSTE